jgi:hypothetical protein
MTKKPKPGDLDLIIGLSWGLFFSVPIWALIFLIVNAVI